MLELGLEKKIFGTHRVEPEVLIHVLSLSWMEKPRTMRVGSSTPRKKHGQPAPPGTQERQRRR